MTGHTGYWRTTRFLICATEPAHKHKETYP
jgi:hypothetical protein